MIADRLSPNDAVKKVVVFGATGAVGLSAARHFHDVESVPVVGVSRRDAQIVGMRHVKLDLSDRAECDAVLGGATFQDTTHVVYAALQESGDLAAGWQDPELMTYNLRLFENALEPLLQAHGSSLLHVSLLQGAKAYGLHVGSSPLPAKEGAPRDRHENFYFLQEDALRKLCNGGSLSWTILRPQVVYGESIGSPMNLLPAIGVYATLEKAHGRPLCFPGGTPTVQEAVDARLLARAINWAGESREATNEIFNVTNGDVFSGPMSGRTSPPPLAWRSESRRWFDWRKRCHHGLRSGPRSSTVTGSMRPGTCPHLWGIHGVTPTSCLVHSAGDPRRLCSARSRSAKPDSMIASIPRICSAPGSPSCRRGGCCLPHFSRDRRVVDAKWASPCRPRAVLV